MTPASFRKLALSFADAIEAQHMGHPDFRIRNKIFASLGAPSAEWAMVRLAPEQQSHFLSVDVDAFRPCSGAWGLGGATSVRLAKAKTSLVREALKLPYENLAIAKPSPRAQKSLSRRVRLSPTQKSQRNG